MNFRVSVDRVPRPSCVPMVKNHVHAVNGFWESSGTVDRCAVGVAIASVSTVGSSSLHRSGSAQCVMHTGKDKTLWMYTKIVKFVGNILFNSL